MLTILASPNSSLLLKTYCYGEERFICYMTMKNWMKKNQVRQRCHNMHSKLLYCLQKAKNLTRISVEVWCQVFIKRRLFVPADARCCQKHFESNYLKPDVLKSIAVVADHSFVDDKTLTDLLNAMRQKIFKKKKLTLMIFLALKTKIIID